MSFSLQSPTTERMLPDTASRFDPLDYALHLRRHWAFVALACGVAMGLALVLCLLLPKRYTATASILIEPPAGTDPRMATAISPIYLESLKTYETVATSGALFQRALDRFHLRDQGGAIEAIKARVLKVSKLRETRVLQISVTLENPKQAQAMVQFMAEETVKLIASLSHANSQDLLTGLRQQTERARERLDAAQSALAKASHGESVYTLRAEVDALIELQSRTRAELYQAEADKAAYDSESAKARVGSYSQRLRELDERLGVKTRTLAASSAQLDGLQADLKSAQADYDLAIKRQQEVGSSAAASGERLQIVDPGIVPERPSEPRPVLYTGLAGLFALIGSLLWLSFRYGLGR